MKYSPSTKNYKYQLTYIGKKITQLSHIYPQPTPWLLVKNKGMSWNSSETEQENGCRETFTESYQELTIK